MAKLMRIIIATSMTIFVLLMAIVLAIGGLGYILPPPNVRRIAFCYLNSTFNPYTPYYSAMTPEAVTAIIWDFRGLDTLFETIVFYLAIISSVAIMRWIELPKKYRYYGMSPIVKTVTKITLCMILAVAASITLHGHLTPGGGFQGGATAAIAPLLVLVVFSVYVLHSMRVSKENMLILRSLGLLGVGLTAFIVLLVALIHGIPAFVFQNQPKPYSPVGLPWKLGEVLTSGTPLLFNISEMFAVAAGFTIVFILLAIPESEALKVMKGEGYGH